MALPISIEALIKQQIVENTRLDYKRDWNPEKQSPFGCGFKKISLSVLSNYG